MDFLQYTQDQEYRMKMKQYQVASHPGNYGIAYEFHIPSENYQWLGRDYEISIIRHNKNGSYTQVH